MKTRAELLEYIRTLTADLAHVADDQQWDMLAYLFRMVKLEADRISPGSTLHRLPLPEPVVSKPGYWHWNVTHDRMFGDEHTAAFFNIDKDTGRRGSPLSEWQNAVHPDDQQHVGAQLMGSVETGSEYNPRFRVIAPDGTIRHVQANGRCLFDPQGRPTRFPGTIRQVTAGAARLSEIDIDVILKRGRQTH